MSRRRSEQIKILCLASLILIILRFGFSVEQDSLAIDFANKNVAPSAHHLFGFDSYGRDLFLRVAKGLYLSCSLAFIAMCISLCIVLVIVLILVATPSKKHLLIDKIIELFLSVPQMVLLILISVACGKGFIGVVLGIALTHWAKLARLVKTECSQILVEPYILASRRLGMSSFWILIHHVLPHLFSQIAVNLVLLFPHAIIHESTMSFLGFGLGLESCAIGVILSEATSKLGQGYWWQWLFPGLSLSLLILGLWSLGKKILFYLAPYKEMRL